MLSQKGPENCLKLSKIEFTPDTMSDMKFSISNHTNVKEYKSPLSKYFQKHYRSTFAILHNLCDFYFVYYFILQTYQLIDKINHYEFSKKITVIHFTVKSMVA